MNILNFCFCRGFAAAKTPYAEPCEASRRPKRAKARCDKREYDEMLSPLYGD